MALQELEPRRLLSPPMLLDALFCEEESFEEENGIEEDGNENTDEKMKKHSLFRFVLVENDMAWDDDELVSLISKEGETHVCLRSLISDESLMVARKEAVDWILRVKPHYGFSALTIFLAVNYFDRFASRPTFQRDKPWMSQLVAVACLSLAAKVEETQVPLLLDLQVEESKYVFEARTIQRMELLVLSTLQWRMNPVTPMSFFDHIIRRLGLKNHLHWEFMWRCERLVLFLIADSRVMTHLPSTLAAATMLHVIEDIELSNLLEYQNHLMRVLKISEQEKVNECCKLIQEISESHGQCIHNQSRKRKNVSIPSSPKGVIDAYFSSDSSNDSWAVASLVSSSPEPRFKRSKAQDQQMRLPSLNRVSVGVLSSPP
ncbi:cyclin-D3-2 isoform X1 [Juglans microcarpa x Juglans regia]|uniref:cyclin-D3-2 isoform X1 n=1 Tax=Juglans microcarpa x Juglans regia TaxID=2249226 RepID=UPI001B7F7833|nr:cyclin-D3-2 isoform X1 [Juglans microcarpa x Juglans regia]